MKQRVLVVDDHMIFLRTVVSTLNRTFDVDSCSSVEEAKRYMARHDYMAAVIDLHFEGGRQNGTALLEVLAVNHPKTKAIVMTGSTDGGLIIKASKQPYYNLLFKDGMLIRTIEKELLKIAERRLQEDEPIMSYPSRSPQIKALLNYAERILKMPNSAPIFVTGETGSGKEKLVQHLAARLNKRVVAVNMANVQKTTGESVLFGHVKGAFTGALESKIGLIESAHKGILFLDEIGECSMGVQAKLLRTLQEHQVTPLGSNQSRSIDVQFIAATHQNIEHKVQIGKFRLDLLGRLNTFQLHIPPLRERPEDVGFYARMFLEELSPQGKNYYLSSDADRLLLEHAWPGNIRELRNVIQRALVFTTSLEISAKAMAESIGGANKRRKLPATRKTITPEYLETVLFDTNGNKRLAARILGIAEATLYRWLK